MKVLHFIPTLGSGGAERQLTYLCGGLVELGCEAHVATIRDGVNLARLGATGAEHHRIHCTSPYDPRLPVLVARLIHRVRPDVVQSWLPMMNILAGCASWSLRVPWIMTERSRPSEVPKDAKLRVQDRLARAASAIVSNSTGASEYWSARVAGNVRSATIRNALPLDELDASPPARADELGLSEELPLVISVGRLVASKQPLRLVEAIEGAMGRAPSVGLICGEGPLAPEVAQRIATRGLEGRIAAPGFLSDVPSWLKSASVFLSLSRYEGMPNAVMEAMWVGCPIVASDTPPHREILDESCALLVSPEDTEAAAQAISSVLDDAESAGRRAEEARRRAAAWSIAAVAQEYQDLYEAVAPGARGRS